MFNLYCKNLSTLQSTSSLTVISTVQLHVLSLSLSPAWLLLCLPKAPGSRIIVPCWSQSQGFSPVWIHWWIYNTCDSLKLFPHWSQTWSFFQSECSLSCLLSERCFFRWGYTVEPLNYMAAWNTWSLMVLFYRVGKLMLMQQSSTETLTVCIIRSIWLPLSTVSAPSQEGDISNLSPVCTALAACGAAVSKNNTRPTSIHTFSFLHYHK